MQSTTKELFNIAKHKPEILDDKNKGKKILGSMPTSPRKKAIFTKIKPPKEY